MFEVIVTAGDSHIGGDDFDEILLKHFADEFEKKYLENITQNPEALSKLVNAKLEKSKIDEVVLAGLSTRIPKVQIIQQAFFKNKELKNSVIPYEAVAYKAATYAAQCFGVDNIKIGEIRLADVTPLSLGISVRGDVTSTIIQQNAQIPTEATRKYYTTKDNDSGLLIVQLL